MDMLSFAENVSSVVVTVNKIKSSCPNQNCLYKINDTNVPIIMSYTFTDPQLVITLAANTLVNSTSVSVSIDNVPCVLGTVTSTSITCNFEAGSDGKAKIVAGNYMPKVLLNPKGYCLYDSTCTNITIPLVINSFYPT